MTESEQPKFRLVPRDEYSAKKARLTGERLQRVEDAEARIARNPDDGEDRWPSDGGGWIDYSPSDSGSMIEFKRADQPDQVDLIDLIDVAAAAGVRRWPQESD